MMLKNIPHQSYYFLELGVLFSGFFLIFLLSYDFLLQTVVLFFVLLTYCVLGIFHHKLHHALGSRIVIEYILISLVIMASFLFINTGKI